MLTSVPLALTSSGGLEGLLARIGLAFLFGLGVAGLRAVLGLGTLRDGLAWVLAVLAPALTLVVGAIGGDLAKAFGLVGVLALVRFRAPMRDPADAVFVLLSVGAGVVVAAAEDLFVAAGGIAAVGASAAAARVFLATRAPRRRAHPVELRATCPLTRVAELEAAVAAVAGAAPHVDRVELAPDGTSGALRLHVVPRSGVGLVALASALASVPGVSAVSARPSPP